MPLTVWEDPNFYTQLKASYCRAADMGWDRRKPDAERMISLFTADGVWDAGPFPGGGIYKGHKEIFDFFDSGRNVFGMHCVSNPIIKVNGDNATGQWQLLAPGSVGEDYLWIGGIYDDQFVRTPQGWRFKLLKVTVTFTSVPDKGFDVYKTFAV